MSQPFARARAMFALIATAMAAANSQAALAAIPAYRSRGKGKGKPFIKQHYGNKAGKYMPHQGKRECARRLHQLNTGVR